MSADPVRIRLYGSVPGSVGFLSAVRRDVSATDTHITVHAPRRTHSGRDTDDGGFVFTTEAAGADDAVFEIGEVDVTLEVRLMRSILRVGGIELKIPPACRRSARALVRHAGGREV